MIHPDKVQLLADECGNLKSAMTHLFFSMERTRGLVPRIREELSLEELERLESLASRFARLADMLIQRLMRLIDEVELAPPGTVLDRIHRAEKRGWVDDARSLIRIRELRNLIAHEYAAEKMMEIYEEIVVVSPDLTKVSQNALDYAERLVNSLRDS